MKKTSVLLLLLFCGACASTAPVDPAWESEPQAPVETQPQNMQAADREQLGAQAEKRPLGTSAARNGGSPVNKVAAVVNGQVITMFDLQRVAVQDLAQSRLSPDNPAHAKEVDAILRKTLDTMILDILLQQEAKRLNITVLSSELDEEISKMMKARNMTKSQFEEQLARQKISVAEFRRNMERRILGQKVMSREVGRRVVVTPEEIKTYYEEHKDTLYKREGLHMGLLVYRPNVNASSIAAQIRSGQISFEQACAKYSIAPNQEKGGDMGPIQWERLNPEWEGRLTRMKPGDVTALFDLQGRKAQVRLFRPGGGEERILTLEEATPMIDALLRHPKAKERFDEYSSQLKRKAVIDIRL